MILYLDTSVIVAAITPETSTAHVQSWLEERRTEAWAISDWCTTEVSSALSMKLRTGQISLEARAAALAQFKTMVAHNLTIWRVEARHFDAAAGFCDRHELAIRSGDALHAAVCASNRARLCTQDLKLAAAAPLIGLEVERV